MSATASYPSRFLPPPRATDSKPFTVFRITFQRERFLCPPRARILLIDDDAALLEAIPRFLELRLPGIAVETSLSALRIPERVKEQDYQAIICDMNMPVMNGFALMTEIRHLRPWTPILMLTGNQDDTLIQKATQAGVYDFIRKPVNRDMLMLAIKRAIEVSDLRGHQREKVLCVEGLPVSIGAEEFRKLVVPFGNIVRVRLVVDAYEDGRHVVYGYVEFGTVRETEYAKMSLDGSQILGRQIQTSISYDAIQGRSAY